MDELNIAATRSSHCKNPFCIGAGFPLQLSSTLLRVSVAIAVKGKDSGIRLPELTCWFCQLFAV